jgi:hypothetical protein
MDIGNVEETLAVELLFHQDFCHDIIQEYGILVKLHIEFYHLS